MCSLNIFKKIKIKKIIPYCKFDEEIYSEPLAYKMETFASAIFRFSTFLTTKLTDNSPFFYAE